MVSCILVENRLCFWTRTEQLTTQKLKEFTISAWKPQNHQVKILGALLVIEILAKRKFREIQLGNF